MASKAIAGALKKMGLPSVAKAKKMLKEGMAHGKPLSEKFRRLLQMIAHGKVPTRLSDVSKKARGKIA